MITRGLGIGTIVTRGLGSSGYTAVPKEDLTAHPGLSAGVVKPEMATTIFKPSLKTGW